MANLRPPWTKETRPKSPGRPPGQIQERLQAKLEEVSSGSRYTWTERIVDRWVRDAAKGNGYARQQILDRYFPVPSSKDEAGQRVILQSLTLELDGARRPVFEVRHGEPASRALPATASPASPEPASDCESPASPGDGSSS